MVALLDRARLIGSDDEPETTAAAALGDPDALPELDGDPAPARPARRSRFARKSAASKATAAKQTRTGGKFVSRSKQVEQLGDELEAYARLAALTWSVTDPGCAAVLNDTSADIVRALAALLGRSDWVLERLQTTTLLADVVKLGHAALPLVRAIWTHHGPGSRADVPPQEEEERATISDYPAWRPGTPAGAY